MVINAPFPYPLILHAAFRAPLAPPAGARGRSLRAAGARGGLRPCRNVGSDAVGGWLDVAGFVAGSGGKKTPYADLAYKIGARRACLAVLRPGAAVGGGSREDST